MNNMAIGLIAVFVTGAAGYALGVRQDSLMHRQDSLMHRRGTLTLSNGDSVTAGLGDVVIGSEEAVVVIHGVKEYAYDYGLTRPPMRFRIEGGSIDGGNHAISVEN